MDFAERVQKLSPEGAYYMLGRAQAMEAAGKNVIHFEIGQPDFPTFSNVAEAGAEAIRAGNTRYTPPAGVGALREAIAAQASAQRGLRFEAANVVVGPGAKPAVLPHTGAGSSRRRGRLP
jgi:aspartate/methionine/tyrosine aminotransferase